MILAGIVTYNPDVERLIENINSIYDQVYKIAIVDNGSKNIEEIKDVCTRYNAILIQNGMNLGIARALNEICEIAEQLRCDWFLTLDQDSVVQKGLIQCYASYENMDNVAMLTCIIKDRNSDRNEEMIGSFVDVKLCITSGTLCNTNILRSIGGFDDSLFIDLVDLDVCQRLILHNYRIIKVNFYGLLHEMGNAENVLLFNRVITLYNENPQRLYYIARNTVVLLKKYKHMMYMKLLLINLFKVVILEKNKMSRIPTFFMGVWHGIIGRKGKYDVL